MKKTEMFCLLCAQPLHLVPSWKSLLVSHFPPCICNKCSTQFQRSSIPTALYQYNDAMKKYLHQYKFLQDVALAKVFRQEIHALLKRQRATIIPIPMHPQKQQERTFSHTEELLKAANIPYTQLLEKTTTETQSSKNRAQRLQSAPLFQILPNAHVERKDYLLFDDIETTGTTLRHAKDALLEAGAQSVRTFTLING